MEKQAKENATVQQEAARPGTKETTRFDRRVNWLKDHPVYSWVLLVAFISGSIWALLPKPVKDAVNDKIGTVAENAAASSESDRLRSIIKHFYADLETGSFKAADYFAPQVKKYILVPNTTPAEIDGYFRANSLEFIAPHAEILDSTFSVSKDPAGNQTCNFWVKFDCFRKSKRKYQSCNTRVEFVFDKDSRVTSFTELGIDGLKYHNKERLMEGSVGKLSAVFKLRFDYEHKKVTGTYFYPSRAGVVYSIDGTIAGNQIVLTEYTDGPRTSTKTATCTLKTTDNRSFTGKMHNTDGRVLNMTIRSSELLYME